MARLNPWLIPLVLVAFLAAWQGSTLILAVAFLVGGLAWDHSTEDRR